MLIETRDSLDPELGALVTAAQREIRSPHSVEFAPDDDTEHLVAVVAGRAVACAGWRPLRRGVAELRRLYVRPAFRNRGIARQLIVAVEEEALAVGRPVIRLETGADLPAAIALYESSGYHRIPVFGPGGGVAFEKTVSALVQ